MTVEIEITPPIERMAEIKLSLPLSDAAAFRHFLGKISKTEMQKVMGSSNREIADKAYLVLEHFYLKSTSLSP